MSPSWFFPPTASHRIQGRGLAEDNFAQEERSGLDILIREAFQNPLDARVNTDEPVRVRVALLQPGQFDAHYLASLLGHEYVTRLAISGGESLPDVNNASVLILEDFGTTGLEGNYQNPDVEGNQENWNAFWFREGEGAKPGGSNGRAGQGKITYYRVSDARAVFGVTVRQSDGRRLLMGRSSFRKMYSFNGIKHERDAFWCEQRDPPLPVTNADEIDRFCEAFKLVRRRDEPGLSLAIPFVGNIDVREAMQTVIAEYYVPIIRGRLEVEIAGKRIDRTNLDAVAKQVLPDDDARDRKSSFTEGFRGFVKEVIEDESSAEPVELSAGWEKLATLSEACFPDGALEAFREKLSKGERVSIRFPLTVKPKKELAKRTWFDVHLQVPDDLDRVEEAYVRRDLLIGSEKHLTTSSYLQKARGLTLIEHDVLSALMADAEEPTHLKWNASRPRLAEDYANPKEVVRAVRQAPPRLLAVLSNDSVKQDVKTLAKYFTRPAAHGPTAGAGGGKAGGKKTGPETPPPTPKPKPFRIATDANVVRVLPNGAHGPKPGELPIHCSLELAYEGLNQDPFAEYDPFDFDLSDSDTFKIISSGIQIISSRENRVEFDVIEPAFNLQIGGFDSNIRVRARLNFEGTPNGTTFSAE